MTYRFIGFPRGDLSIDGFITTYDWWLMVDRLNGYYSLLKDSYIYDVNSDGDIAWDDLWDLHDIIW